MNAAVDAESEHIPAEHGEKHGWLLALCCAAFALFHIYTSLAGSFQPLIQRGLFIGGAMALAFWSLAEKPQNRSWRRIAVLAILAGASFYVGVYAMLQNRSFMDIMYDLSLVDKITGVVAIVLVLVATQRILGWALPVLTTLSLLYYFWGYYAIRGYGHRLVYRQIQR